MRPLLALLAATALASCAGGGLGGYTVTPTRVGALYPSKGDACAARFENLTFLEASSKYENLGMVTLTGASGVFTHEAKVIVDHDFRRWLIGSAFASYGIDDYHGIGRVDDRFTYGGALTYYFNRSLALRGELLLRQIQSVASPDCFFDKC